MAVRCKMFVSEKTDSASRLHGTADPAQQRSVVKLVAATDETNETWAKYTPSGHVELQIDNPAAFDAFKLGQYYFVDFVEAPTDEASEQPK